MADITNSKSDSVLITGTAGFIGFHLAQRLLEAGHRVIGIDGMTDYYDVSLKQRRHQMLKQSAGFSAHEVMLEDASAIADICTHHKPDILIHLAAQAGVRYSVEAPRSYVDSNLIGSFNILEAARHQRVRHLLMASTSSIYGAGGDVPFTEAAVSDLPLSFYAATKKATETMAHSYAHIHGIPTTMIRFFTAYGPWGRPDMALFRFTRAMLEGEPIDVYNHGHMRRDFTYIDDLIEAIGRLMCVIPPAVDKRGVDKRDEKRGDSAACDSLSPVAPWRAVNIGMAAPVALLEFIHALESALGVEAEKNMLPMQPGDVPETWADISLLKALTGFTPSTGIEEGVSRFVAWYRDYYQV